MDISELKASVDIVEVVQRDKKVALKKHGSGFLGMCPFHNDTTPSLNVSRKHQSFKCFACGSSGDVIDYVVKRKGIGVSEAISVLSGREDFKITNTSREIIAKAEVEYEFVLPIPEPFTPPSFMHYKFGMPKAVWEYRGVDGVYGYACRFERYDDKKGRVVKDVLPYCVVRRGRSMRWEYLGFRFKDGIPLYGLHKLQSDKGRSKTVIVVEGEKTCDALQKVLPHVIVVSWMGGANRVSLSDWKILKDWGGAVLCWADNDWQGWAAMVHVMKILDRECEVIGSPEGSPKGWDFADSDWGLSETRVWCSENRSYVVADEKGRYDFGLGGLVMSEFGWGLKPKPWK